MCPRLGFSSLIAAAVIMTEVEMMFVDETVPRRLYKEFFHYLPETGSRRRWLLGSDERRNSKESRTWFRRLNPSKWKN